MKPRIPSSESCPLLRNQMRSRRASRNQYQSLTACSSGALLAVADYAVKGIIPAPSIDGYDESMGWTRPRLLAHKNEWYGATLDHEGPACYEIGTGGPRGGNIEWHYVGETVNEKKRMSRYGADGSHLSKMINYHLKHGWHIYYHACACPSKEAAKRMQDNLLERWEYDWNHIGN